MSERRPASGSGGHATLVNTDLSPNPQNPSIGGTVVRTSSPSPPSSPLLEARWNEHLRGEARRILRQLAVVLAGAILCGLAFDALLMDDSEAFGVAKIALPLEVLICLLGAACLHWWPLAGRYPHGVGGAFAALLMATCGYSLAELGGMDSPFFYVAYLIPCIALGVPATLRTRVVFTATTLGAFLFAFFGNHHEHLTMPHSHVAWVHLTCVTIALTFFGHTLHNVSRELFILRNAAVTQSELLVRDKAELTEEVQTQTKNLLAVTDRAERVRVEERIDLARVLHDDMGQLIVSARAGIYNLEKSLRTDDNAPLAGLRLIVEDIERSARNVIGALRESELPFEVAVEDLVEMYRALEHVEIDIKFDCREWEPEPVHRQLCLSIVQESLTNVIKHAKARSVRVSIALREALTIAIADDGVGMPKDSTGTGFGITGLRERVARAGGTLTYQPSDSGGTQVLVRLPLASGIPTQRVSSRAR